MQRVDPFIPAGPKQLRRSETPKMAAMAPGRAVDGVVRRSAGPVRRPHPAIVHKPISPAALHPRAPVAVQPAPRSTPTEIVRKTAVAPPQPAKKEHWWHKLQWPAAVLAAMAIGSFAQYLIVGYAMLAIYTVAVIVFRINSRRTFTLALVALAAVAFAQLLGRSQVVESFAVYAFLLFGIGTLSLIIEVIMAGRRSKQQTVKT